MGYCITLYAKPRRQKEGQQALLLRRRQRPRRGQAPHCPPGLPGHRREAGGNGPRPRRPPSLGGFHARVWFASGSLVGGAANRSVGFAPVPLARATLRPVASPLFVAGGPASRVSARAQDGGGRLVSQIDPFGAVGRLGRALQFASFLGRIRTDSAGR